jgi:hypothetical protein
MPGQPVRHALPVLCLLGLALPPWTAHAASSPEALEADIAQLRARLQQLELDLQARATPPANAPRERAEAAPSAAAPVQAGTLPGSFKLPGTDTSLKLYGMARLDTTYDFRQRIANVNAYGWANALFVQPLDDSAAGQRHGQSFATARGSRFGLLTATPTAAGVLNTKIEADFDGLNTLGGETATTFRLREAYGQLNGWLVGQTFSTFTDLRASPDIVEWNGTGIQPTIRQAMVRYTQPVAKAHRFDVAVENSVGSSLAKSPVTDYDTAFDLVAGYTHDAGWGHVSARAVTVKYHNDRGGKQGWGLAASGRGNLSAQDHVVLLAVGGAGIGRYMFNGSTQSAIDTPEGIRLWRGGGVHLGYGHRWSDTWRTTVAYARTQFARDDLANTTQRANSPAGADFYPNQRLTQWFLTTWWSPLPQVDAGVDYTHGRRVTFNGERGTVSRLSGMVRYKF